MLDKEFKYVFVSYKDGFGKNDEKFLLVTDIQYHDNYILIEHYYRPDKTTTRIISTDIIARITVEDLNKFDAERDWVRMNNSVCGNDFTRIKFWPFEGKKSEIHIYPIYGKQKGAHLLFTNVLNIERKWNHDIKGNELYIRTIEFGKYDGFHNIEKIIVLPEEYISKFIIKRAEYEDLVINVNGGKYRNEN